MRDKTLLNDELVNLTNRLKGQVVFRGNPAASGLPAFTKTVQHGRKFETTIITEVEFVTAGKDPANQSNAIPPLSPELALLAAHNVASWMPESTWEALVDAVLDDEPPPDGVDARTVEYMSSLPRRALHRFIGEVDAAREEAENRAENGASVTHAVIEGDESTESAISSRAEGDGDTSSDSKLAGETDEKESLRQAFEKAIFDHDFRPNW